MQRSIALHVSLIDDLYGELIYIVKVPNLDN